MDIASDTTSCISCTPCCDASAVLAARSVRPAVVAVVHDSKQGWRRLGARQRASLPHMGLFDVVWLNASNLIECDALHVAIAARIGRACQTHQSCCKPMFRQHGIDGLNPSYSGRGSGPVPWPAIIAGVGHGTGHEWTRRARSEP